MVIFSQPRGDREEQPCHAWQAVCGTTHKGSWVKLLLCFISIQWHGRVRISERDKSNPGIKTPLPFLSFSEKHYGRERLGGFSRSHNACYWLHKAISMSLSWFGDDRRSILSILRSFFSEDFMYCFVHMYIIFISEWKRSVVHTWICLSKNIHPLVVFIYLMDFTTGKEGEREQTAGWEIVSHSNLFSSTSLYYFASSARLKSSCANKSSIRQGENRPKEPNCYSTMEISEASAAEINHDPLCAFIEVSAVYRFCYKPNLTVLKSCMMLSRSLIMVLYFGRDLWQFIASPKDYIKIWDQFIAYT